MTTTPTTSSTNRVGSGADFGGFSTSSGPVAVVVPGLSVAMPSPDTLAVFAGGLGSNQFAKPGKDGVSLADLARTLPNVIAVEVGDPGYFFNVMSDLIGLIAAARAKYPTIKRVVLFGHSMAWLSARKVCLSGAVDVFVAVDPASPYVQHDEWPVVEREGKIIPVVGVLILAEPTRGIHQIPITGAPATQRFPCKHNPVVQDVDFQESALTLLDGGTK